MRNSYLYTGLVALLFASFYLVSCLNEDNKIPPNCYDGVLNQDETAIDCGGVCERCDPCLNGLWDVLEGETCIDCGGDCEPCTPCHNCVLDENEFGIDCGGSCNIECDELCDDGILNGTETEIDCGGTECEPCPTCIDIVMNGSETGIDCGDPAEECPQCSTDGSCINGVIDGEEAALNCGNINGNAGLPGYCPVCVNSLTWYANGIFMDGENDLSATYVGGADSTITFTGTTDGGEIMAFSITRPVAGWVWGANFTMNLNTNPGKVGVYTDAFGAGWFTALIPETSGFTMEFYTVDPQVGGVISGTFQGLLPNGDTPPLSTTITSGRFLLNLE